MTGPYADTLTAMSNYLKHTGEGQSRTDLQKSERGLERKRENITQRAKTRVEFTQSSPDQPVALLKIHLCPCSLNLPACVQDNGRTWRHSRSLPVCSSPVHLPIRFHTDLPGLVVLHYKPCPHWCVFAVSALFHLKLVGGCSDSNWVQWVQRVHSSSHCVGKSGCVLQHIRQSTQS